MKRRNFILMPLGIVTLASARGLAQAKKGEKADKARDPVCGLTVDKNPELSAAYKGETYYFCTRADMEQFKKSPEKYVKK